MLNYVIYTFLGVVAAMALAWPMVGVLGYLAMTLMTLHLLGWGKETIPWAMVMVVATVIGWSLSFDERKRLPVNAISIAMVALLGWTLITLPFALYPWAVSDKADLFLKAVIASLLFMAILNTRERIHQAVWAMVLSMGFFTIRGGLIGVVSGGGTEVSGPDEGPFNGNNSFARMCIMTAPLLLYLTFHAALPWVRKALFVALGLTGLGLVVSGSRGGLIGFVVMGAFYWLFSRNKMRLVAAGAAALALGYMAIPGPRLEALMAKFGEISEYEEVTTANQRFEAWTYAWELALSRPVIGGGFGAFAGNINVTGKEGRGLESHSIYFQWLGEHGFVGLGLFLLLVGIGFATAYRVMRLARGRPELYWARDLSFMFVCMFVGYLAGGITITHSYLELYYFSLGVLAAVAQVARRQVGEAISVEPRRRRVAAGVGTPEGLRR